ESQLKHRLIRDRGTGMLVGYAEVPQGEEVTCLELSRAGDRVLFLQADGSACVAALPAAPEWLLEAKPLWKARLRHTRAVALSPRGKLVVSGREDGVLHVWDTAARTRLCHAIGLPDGRWAVSDDMGRFDASNGGRMAGLHWVLDTDLIELDQLKAKYYEPF